MNCHQCQHPLPVTARFCGKCGAAVVKPEAAKPPVAEVPVEPLPTAAPVAPAEHTPEPVLPELEPLPPAEVTDTAHTAATVVEPEAPAPEEESTARRAEVTAAPVAAVAPTPAPVAAVTEHGRDVTLPPAIDPNALAELKQMISMLQNSQALSLKLLGDKANVSDMRELAMQLFDKQLQALQQHETQVRQQLVALLQHHVKGLPERSDWLTQADLSDIRQQLQVLRQEETRTQQALVSMDETMRQIPQAVQQALSSAVTNGVAHALKNLPAPAPAPTPAQDQAATAHREEDELPGAEQSNHFLAVFLIGLLAGLTLVLGTMTLMNFVSASAAKPAIVNKVKPSGH